MCYSENESCIPTKELEKNYTDAKTFRAKTSEPNILGAKTIWRQNIIDLMLSTFIKYIF